MFKRTRKLTRTLPATPHYKTLLPGELATHIPRCADCKSSEYVGYSDQFRVFICDPCLEKRKIA